VGSGKNYRRELSYKEIWSQKQKEVWKTQSLLRKYRRITRLLLGKNDEQSVREKEQILRKLYKLSLLDEGAELEDVLTLTVESFLGRRLQTLVFLNGIARTPGQARQMIVHGHIKVNERVVRAPSYPLTREDVVSFDKTVEVMRVPEVPVVKEVKEVPVVKEVKEVPVVKEVKEEQKVSETIPEAGGE
jgi:SSU ribosomal protein S4P